MGRFGPLLLAIAGVAACLVAARLLLEEEAWLTPWWTRCWLRYYTGLPCPACGSTRSLAALGKGEIVSALRYNPLLVLLVAGVLARPWLRLPWNRTLGWVAAGLVLLNWIYLLLYLPR